MPKHLNSRCKELVASLLSYFQQELENKGPLLPLTAVRERVAAALNLNISTVSAISQSLKSNELLKSPKKKRSHAKRITNVEILDIGAIRETIYQMYETKQHVTVSRLSEKLRERQLFDGYQTSLRNLLKEIGFRWKKDDPRRGLLELPHVAIKRLIFLREYMKEKEESLYQFVFLDETWIHCMFNPIEHIWGIAKNYYNRHVGRDGATEIHCLDMWKESLGTITPEMWKNSIRHTEDEIRKWYDREHVSDRLNTKPMVINLNESSDSSDSNDDNQN